MKKVMLLLVIVLALIGATACGGGNTPTTETTTTVAADTTAGASEETTSTEATSSNAEATTESSTDANGLTILEDLELVKLDGTTVKLSEVTKKHTIVNFWATWCGYCKKEMPDLVELAKRDDVAVIFISQGEPADTVRQYMKTMGYEFDVYIDPSKTYTKKYEITGYPHNMFLTENRAIMFRQPGYMEKSEIENMLKQIEDFRKAKNI